MADWTQGLPYDGWYNGNVDLMIANGTYEDFRDKLVERVNFGFYDRGTPNAGYVLLKEWDTKWEAISHEDKLKRRERVVEDTTPKEVNLMTSKGMVRVMKAKPSENNNADQMQDHKSRDSKRKTSRNIKRAAKGGLTKEDNPLLKSSPKTK